MASERPFAIYKKGELHYLGMHKDEAACWHVALGWPSPEEIEWEKRTNGLICLPVRVIALSASTKESNQ